MYVPEASDKQDWQGVWVVGEVQNGIIQDVTYELLGKARELSKDCGGEVWTVILTEGLKEDLGTLFHYQADKVLLVEDPILKEFHDEIEALTLNRLITTYKPNILLCGATSRGRALMPRVAVLTEAGLTADCTSLSVEAETGCLLIQTRPAFGGNMYATIKSQDYRPQMATVRPRVMEMLEPDTSRKGEVIEVSLEGEEKNAVKKVLQSVIGEEDSMNISDAEFIIAGGRGVKGPEGFELLEKLAAAFNGAVGASRAAVDAGWIAYPHQVGQTGQTVQAKVYIACGISGQIQHLVGMQSSDLIIAINKDPEAPIMKLADIAIPGDLFEIIPALLKEAGKA